MARKQIGSGQYGYVAGYASREIEVWADGLWPAKQAALAEFKPPKSRAHEVWVILAYKDGDPVVHVAVD